MSSERTTQRHFGAHARAISGAAVLGAMISCSIPTQSGDVGEVPDQKSFIDNNVSLYMERRCGGLDCHGQVGRPLRLYSEWGLRLQANKDGSRNSSATTTEERVENYKSVVGLEPENLAQCFATKGASFATFQLLRKPIGIEGTGGVRHKGGSVLRPTPTDPGWQCLYGWASGTVDPKQCEEAANVK